MSQPCEEIMDLISDVIIPHPNPAVYISGGIDSTILLHHLSKKSEDPIRTYTFGFPEQKNEFKQARKVAEHYGTEHTEVLIDDFIHRLPEIQRYMDRPRFNVQTYWLAEQAAQDGCETAYIGEGLDEHFGGYWQKPHLNYLESWADHFMWIRPTHEQVHRVFGVGCEIPFTYLPFRKTLPYWDPKREKEYLKIAYGGVLPSFVIDRCKKPGRPHWRSLWNRELHNLFPHYSPKNDAEIRAILNRYTISVWMGVHL